MGFWLDFSLSLPLLFPFPPFFAPIILPPLSPEREGRSGKEFFLLLRLWYKWMERDFSLSPSFYWCAKKWENGTHLELEERRGDPC